MCNGYALKTGSPIRITNQLMWVFLICQIQNKIQQQKMLVMHSTRSRYILCMDLYWVRWKYTFIYFLRPLLNDEIEIPAAINESFE